MELNKLKVIIDNEAYRQIMFWVNESDYEVSGLGTVVFDPEEGIFRVKSVMLLKQDNTTTHTELDAAATCKAMSDLIHEEGDLRFWWHSHVNMGVFWSGEDMDTIGEKGGEGWVLATVFNKKKEMRSAFYGVGGLVPTFIDNIQTDTEIANDEETALWREEYKRCVTNKVFTQARLPMGPHYGGNLVRIGTEKTHTTGSYQNGGTSYSSLTEQFIPSAEEYEDYEPPNKRPQHMSKREFKKWKRDYREALLEEERLYHQELQKETDSDLGLDDPLLVEADEYEDALDAYPIDPVWEDHCYATGAPLEKCPMKKDSMFTREEFLLMEEYGFREGTIDKCIDLGMDRLDILKSAFADEFKSKRDWDAENERMIQ